MELRHLKYFVMAAGEGSISGAAKRLNITQPAVSRQIIALEEELGVKLLERKPKGLALTKPGETALPLALDLLRRSGELARAMDAFNRPASRSLRVGFITTALPSFLAGAMRAFRQKRSDISIQIKEMSPQEQEAALTNHEIDLALLGAPCPDLAKRFHVAPIRKVPLAVVLPDDHLLALRKSVDLSELKEEIFVTLNEKHYPGRPAMLAELGGKAGFNLKVGDKAEGLQEALGLVAAGSGVAVLPDEVSLLPHPGVVFVKMRRPTLTLSSSAVWKNGDDRDLAELVDLLKKQVV